MNQQKLAKEITNFITGVPKDKINQIIDCIGLIITIQVKKNRKVKINKLGTFCLKEVKKSKFFDFRNKKIAEKPAYKTIKLKASTSIKQNLNS